MIKLISYVFAFHYVFSLLSFFCKKHIVHHNKYICVKQEKNKFKERAYFSLYKNNFLNSLSSVLAYFPYLCSVKSTDM